MALTQPNLPWFCVTLYFLYSLGTVQEVHAGNQSELMILNIDFADLPIL